MVKITINFQLNGSKEERGKLIIDREAEEQFLGEGFASCVYEGEIKYGVYSRCWDPDDIKILIDIASAVKEVIEWGFILASLREFCNKQKGFKKEVIVEYGKEDYIDIDLRESDDKIIERINIEIEEKTSSNKEKIKRFIEAKNKLYCDDCLSEELSVFPRQNVNSIVRRLVKEDGYYREKIKCDKCMKSKLVTYKFRNRG